MSLAAHPPSPLSIAVIGIVVVGAMLVTQWQRRCALPALVWQRTEHGENHWRPMRLSLIADTAATLPVLQAYHRTAALADRVASGQAPTGVAALDEVFRFSGEEQAWVPVLATPAVTVAVALVQAIPPQLVAAR